MGQAKKRGTYEQRLKEALDKRAMAEANKPKLNVKRGANSAALMAAVALVTGAFK